MQVISWSECQLKITGDKSLYLYHPLWISIYKVNLKLRRTEMTCDMSKNMTHTGKLYSHRLSYY